MNKKNSSIPSKNHPLRVEQACTSASVKHQTRHQAQLREELARDVERYLAAGGSIQVLPACSDPCHKPAVAADFFAGC